MNLIVKNFKFVEIRLSMDGLDKQFEYLRYGADFKKVCTNAEKFAALPNTDFEIICTVSIFNVLSIGEIERFCKARNWSVYYNIADYPNYLLLHNLPDAVKEHINLDQSFDDIKKYATMAECNQREWARFIRYTKDLDKNRGLTFKNTFPELYDQVKKHGYE